MKKIIMVVAIVTMACSAQAQEKITWGARVGLNIPSLYGDASGFYKSTVGFHVGAVLDWNVAESFYIQPGLYFTMKGAKMDLGLLGSKSTNLSYLEIPILASYRFNLGRDIKLHVNAGPYFAYGVAGDAFKDSNNNSETNVNVPGNPGFNNIVGNIFGNSVFNNSVVNVSGPSGFNRFDAGLAFGVGVGFLKNYYAGLNYDLGLVNLSKNGSTKNQSFNITIGYNFL